MAIDDFVLVGSYRYVAQRYEYIGIVCRQQGTTMEVLSLGAESSEALILKWIEETIKLMRETGKLDVQAPDMYDRVGH